MAGSFTLAIKAFEQASAQQMTMLYRKVVLDIFSAVVDRTPVRHGTAKGNWQVALNVAPIGFDETIRDPDGSITISEGMAELLKAGTEDQIFIMNSTPYILELENGSSTQAPNGMLAVTISEWPGVVEEATRGS